MRSARVLLLGVPFLLAACSSTPPASPGGTERACTLFRETAGNVEAGDDSANDYLQIANGILQAAQEEPESGTRIVDEAGTLFGATQALASTYGDERPVPVGPALDQLGDAEATMAAACSALGL